MDKGKQQHLRRTASVLLLVAVLGIYGAFPLTAQADMVNSVSIEVQLHKDGSASVTEYWDLGITSPKSTEWYLPMYDLGNIEILDLTVTQLSADGTENLFTTLPDWDSNRSRAEKANTCGLLEVAEGYELCWGLGSTVRTTFRISYTLTNLVKRYEDYDALSYNFVTNAAGTRTVDIRIIADDTPLVQPAVQAQIDDWQADIHFQDGAVEISSTDYFKKYDRAVVILTLKPGLLSPADVSSESLLVPIALSEEDIINDVSISVQLHDDGSATFTELWDTYFGNPHTTEFYLQRYDLDRSEIHNFTVTELFPDGGERLFTSEAIWNPSRTREEKAYKSGLVATNNGYELCLGYGENGSHTYRMTYTITNLVKSYQGGDALHYRFVGDIEGAGQVDIRLAADNFALTYPECRAWVYGYEADYAFQDGAVEIIGRGSFQPNDYAVVVIAFEPDLLHPVDVRSESDLDTVIALNMIDSKWETHPANTNFTTLIQTVFHPLQVLLFFPLLLLCFYFLFKRKSKGNSGLSLRITHSEKYDAWFPKESAADYCRDLPYDGSLSATYADLYLGKKLSRTSIIGALFLKWILNGQWELQQDTRRGKKTISFRLNRMQEDMPELERSLYFKVIAASGPERILRPNDLQKWVKKNERDLNKWLERYLQEGIDQLRQRHIYQYESTVKLGKKAYMYRRTASGKVAAEQALGFVRYLRDFTILSDRTAPEVALWDDYLIYASLFGQADQVAKQFAKLYPQYVSDPTHKTALLAQSKISDTRYESPAFWENTRISLATTSSICQSVDRRYKRSKRAADFRKGLTEMRSASSSSSNSSGSSGSGGSSSSSGGGGYSSGSGGAGTR